MVKALRFTLKLVTFLAALSAGGNAWAGNGTRLPPNHFVGLRPAGMGQAFTAVADDQNALYYNPAGLARLDSWSLEIISPFVGFNNALLQNVDSFMEMQTLLQGGSASTSQTLERLQPIINDVSGKNNFARVGNAPYFVMKNFGIGLYSDTNIELVPHGQALPELLDFSLQSDADFRVGYAHNFFGEKLAVGGSVSYRARSAAIKDNLGLIEFVEISKDKAKSKAFLQDTLKAGTGIGADVGMLFTPVEMWKPTLGVSVLNIGDTRLKKFEKSTRFKGGAPAPIPQSVNMGLSVTPTFGNWFTRGALDFRDLNLPTPASDKPCFGLEGGIKGRFVSGALQGGMAEGYLSGGFEARLLVLTLRYATYKTERGYFPNQNAERRHLLQAKILL